MAWAESAAGAETPRESRRIAMIGRMKRKSGLFAASYGQLNSTCSVGYDVNDYVHHLRLGDETGKRSHRLQSQSFSLPQDP